MQTEEGDADRHEEGAGRRRGGEDIGVVLDDALESAEGVQVRPVLLGKGRGGEGDDANVLGHEDGGGNKHG